MLITSVATYNSPQVTAERVHEISYLSLHVGLDLNAGESVGRKRKRARGAY